MDILVIGSVLIGILLARFFTVYVLFPACIFAIVLVLVSPSHGLNGPWWTILEIAAAITSIQLGYGAGLILQGMPTSLQRFRRYSPYASPPSAGLGWLGHRRFRKGSGGKHARSNERPKNIKPAA
jgi:hypothetical protein